MHIANALSPAGPEVAPTPSAAPRSENRRLLVSLAALAAITIGAASDDGTPAGHPEPGQYGPNQKAGRAVPVAGSAMVEGTSSADG